MEAEQNRVRAAKWHAENPERAKANNAKWRAENAEKVKADQARWAAENPEKMKGYYAKYRTDVWNMARRRALTQGYRKGVDASKWELPLTRRMLSKEREQKSISNSTDGKTD